MAIEIHFTGTPTDLVSKIDSAIKSKDGKFTGDEVKGTIEISTPVGKISAAYKIEGQKVTVDIIEKPMFIPEEMIKNEIAKMI